ncbi:MAG: sugar ABC transporter permease [Spirochaetes bacterium]|nr:MAG: sugar ABC transporter permease [Spirochaetota bacterium]
MVSSRYGTKVKWAAMISLLPLVIILILIRFYPISIAIWKSFTNWDGLYQSDWVGLSNYIEFIKNGPFLKILRNTVILLLNVPLQVFFGLLIALLLYERVLGWRFFRAVIYTPQIISAVIIGYLFKIFFGFRGPVNIILRGIGLDSMAIEWFGNPYTALMVIVISITWYGIGWQAIVMLGGMSTVDPSILEAALLDGANYWQRAFRVMFPMILRVIEFGVIASGVWTLTQLFPFIHVMTRGGPGYETTTLDYMIYIKSFGFSFGINYGMACAIAVILLFFIISITSFEMMISRRIEVKGLK